MSSIRSRSMQIPVDNQGMLGRECPRCRGRFKIDMERYVDRGFMNVRCPYCRFISELDSFTTGEQRNYVYSVARNFSLQMAEEVVGDVFGSSDVDFDRVNTDPPEFGVDVEEVVCADCGFSYQVETGEGGVCPVCR